MATIAFALLVFAGVDLSKEVSAAPQKHTPVKTTKDGARKALQVNPDESGEVISSQWHGGFWKTGGIKGRYRFVVTQPSKAANRLYIQWWQTQEEGDELMYSLSVRELNEYLNYQISLPQCVNDACQSVVVKARNPVEETEHRYRLDLSRFGEYRLSL